MFDFFFPTHPLALPAVLVTWFDPGARARDIEHVAAILLRLGNETESLAAERMCGKEKIKHKSSKGFVRWVACSGDHCNHPSDPSEIKEISRNKVTVQESSLLSIVTCMQQ